MAIFGPKPWDNPFGKMVIFPVFVLYLRKAFYRSRLSEEKFSLPIFAKKKEKLEKWPFLDQNHGLIPLEKCQFFDFLNFLFLQARKAFFRSRISRKLEKWPFLDQNHGLAPLEKCQFFDFLNFLFIQLRRAFFRSRVLQKPFSWPLLLIKKGGKMAIFGPKP